MRKLSKLVNGNFTSQAGDLFITLTFDENVTQAEALKSYELFLERIKRSIKRQKLPPLRFVLIKEDHGGRQHAHIFAGADLAVVDLLSLWTFGIITISIMEDTGNHVELEEYMLFQHVKMEAYMPKQHGQECSGGLAMDECRKRQMHWFASQTLKSYR